MSLFNNTYMKSCKTHGISMLWYKKCHLCQQEAKLLPQNYYNNLVRTY